MTQHTDGCCRLATCVHPCTRTVCRVLRMMSYRLPMLLLGSTVGGYMGAHLALAKGTALVKRCFELLCLLMGLSLLLKSL